VSRIRGRARSRLGARCCWAYPARLSVRIGHWFAVTRPNGEEERWSCGSLRLDPHGADIGDIADTAAILTQLDRLIVVDTGIVHLA
jgi:hypothetical protein